jgi:hypothetical protein
MLPARPRRSHRLSSRPRESSRRLFARHMSRWQLGQTDLIVIVSTESSPNPLLEEVVPAGGQRGRWIERAPGSSPVSIGTRLHPDILARHSSSWP